MKPPTVEEINHIYDTECTALSLIAETVMAMNESRAGISHHKELFAAVLLIGMQIVQNRIDGARKLTETVQ